MVILRKKDNNVIEKIQHYLAVDTRLAALLSEVSMKDAKKYTRNVGLDWTRFRGIGGNIFHEPRGRYIGCFINSRNICLDSL